MLSKSSDAKGYVQYFVSTKQLWEMLLAYPPVKI